jgi:hypothetical protein
MLVPTRNQGSRNDKQIGLATRRSDFEHNRVWLKLVLLAHDLIAWTQTLLLTGELARCEPKRLRYWAGAHCPRLAISGRTARYRS